MSKYKIGKVIGVSGDKIDVTLLDCTTTEGENIGVPDTMCVNINTDIGPQPLLIGQPGSFIKIAIPTGELLSMITDIQMREAHLSASEIKEVENEGQYPIEFPKRIISAIPIGTIETSGKFERGTDVLPTVNNDVFAVLPKTIDKVYDSYAEGNFSIGKLSLIPQQSAKINLDAFWLDMQRS